MFFRIFTISVFVVIISGCFASIGEVKTKVESHSVLAPDKGFLLMEWCPRGRSPNLQFRSKQGSFSIRFDKDFWGSPVGDVCYLEFVQLPVGRYYITSIPLSTSVDYVSTPGSSSLSEKTTSTSVNLCERGKCSYVFDLKPGIINYLGRFSALFKKNGKVLTGFEKSTVAYKKAKARFPSIFKQYKTKYIAVKE